MSRFFIIVLFILPFLIVGQEGCYLTEVKEETNENFDITVPLVMILAVVLIVTVLIIAKQPPFGKYARYTVENKVKALFILGLRMMHFDRDDLRQQVRYLFNYVQRRFPQYNGASLRKTYALFAQNYVDENIVLTWFLKNATEEDCLQLLDFLADLAYQNHRATKNELRFLYLVARKLNIDLATVRSVISVREKYSQQRNFNERATNSVSSEVLRKQKIKQNLHVLGLSFTKNFDDVRKAYRKLARIMHPDRFHNASPEELKMANERFSSINVAYEELEKLLK